ncbi:MAG: DUF6499 domain-containing protein [Alphaproteobacteria bacterium]|nr:DUF6499 domain-containing protein [Alphaproteobacteria bacterium]
MPTDKALFAKYVYLDDLDLRGWAWEFLRRNDDYRNDFDRLQKLAHPEPFEAEHAALALKWHVRRLIDPESCEVPEFFHERYQLDDDLMWRDPRKWDAMMAELQTPHFNLRTWKHSIICKDLRAQGYSQNEIAWRLYPGFADKNIDIQQHPSVYRVRDDLIRFKKLQAEYIKIAFQI